MSYTPFVQKPLIRYVTANKNATAECYRPGSKSAFLCHLCCTKHSHWALPAISNDHRLTTSKPLVVPQGLVSGVPLNFHWRMRIFMQLCLFSTSFFYFVDFIRDSSTCINVLLYFLHRWQWWREEKAVSRQSWWRKVCCVFDVSVIQWSIWLRTLELQ
jgi:hypothetical protein